MYKLHYMVTLLEGVLAVYSQGDVFQCEVVGKHHQGCR